MPKKRVQNSVRESSVSAADNRRWDFEPLDKNSFTPMYFQIQSQLLKLIQDGTLRAGDLLPSEEELSRLCGVSRMTARQALQSLKSQGLASRQKGHGSFVSQPRVEKDITHFCGFTVEMRALGMKASSQVLEVETSVASPDVAAQLQIEVNAPLFRMLRLRLADELPFAIEEIRLPLSRFPGINKLDFSRLSLYHTLRNRYNTRFSRADEILEARSATGREAKLLGIAAKSSLLVISRTLWGQDGAPVEIAHSVYRGDRYRAILSTPVTAIE